jgi:hypothetical protein
MHDASANRANKITNKRKPHKSSDQNAAPHLCFGQIGISAVAAAARYQGDAKNPAYAPVAVARHQDDATGA